jgi:hypothetical protein
VSAFLVELLAQHINIEGIEGAPQLGQVGEQKKQLAPWLLLRSVGRFRFFVTALYPEFFGQQAPVDFT